MEGSGLYDSFLSHHAVLTLRHPLSKPAALEKELAQANEQIRNLIKGEERMRIARDLHDTLGHTLSLITLKSQLVEKLAVKDPESPNRGPGDSEHLAGRAPPSARAGIRHADRHLARGTGRGPDHSGERRYPVQLCRQSEAGGNFRPGPQYSEPLLAGSRNQCGEAQSGEPVPDCHRVDGQ